MSEIYRYLQKVVDGKALDRMEMARMMQIMTLGGATPAQIAAFFTAIKIRNVHVEEIVGAMTFFYQHKLFAYKEQVFYLSAKQKVDEMLALALVIKSLGYKVLLEVKRSNQWNFTQLLGMNIDLDDKAIGHMLDECGICICYPPKAHPLRNILSIKNDLSFISMIDLIAELYNRFPSSYQVLEISLNSHTPNILNACKLLNRRTAVAQLFQEYWEVSSTTSSVPQKIPCYDFNLTPNAALAIFRFSLIGKDLELVQEIMNFCAYGLYALNLLPSYRQSEEYVHNVYRSGKLQEMIQNLIEQSNRQQIVGH